MRFGWLRGSGSSTSRKSSIIEDCVIMSGCGGICGRIQLASELNIGVPEDVSVLKDSAKEGADSIKSEVKAPAPAPAGCPPSPHAMSR
eukprot:CAMPEP_0197299980 /NCGR_PEP_ID=MMETSP0890-20130614/47276_1 /TAXON_ID=44058 ORGANISM="Aureoumbra lagunensis, Strain CCMP1510" /NCGR_SAMPLE_ID=MMETSP0890 /ASSEMBLY_ACC=CAM_ASM_000533 /LENGTH=87 /DNA_ID=CAMNT_0042778561 /DNA_START=241 /DNA_END=505 /DNA_ORIENTATION=+